MRDVFREASVIESHPRNGSTSTLCHVCSILSVNAGGYIVYQKTRSERIPAWIWSRQQVTHQLKFPENL